MSNSTLTAAIEQILADVRAAHPELPELVVVVGYTGRKRANTLTLGHFSPQSWEGYATHELFVSGECLAGGPEGVLKTVLHEAAHALADARGVKDTSRQGRYHNKRFVSVANELGLVWPEGQEPHSTIGYSAVVLPEGTGNPAHVAALTEALTHHRTGAGQTARTPKAPAKNTKATCACPRIIRVSESVLDEGAIVCSNCGEQFTHTTDND